MQLLQNSEGVAKKKNLRHISLVINSKRNKFSISNPQTIKLSLYG